MSLTLENMACLIQKTAGWSGSEIEVTSLVTIVCMHTCSHELPLQNVTELHITELSFFPLPSSLCIPTPRSDKPRTHAISASVGKQVRVEQLRTFNKCIRNMVL